jgi:hypothetical protein
VVTLFRARTVYHQFYPRTRLGAWPPYTHQCRIFFSTTFFNVTLSQIDTSLCHTVTLSHFLTVLLFKLRTVYYQFCRRTRVRKALPPPPPQRFRFFWLWLDHFSHCHTLTDSHDTHVGLSHCHTVSFLYFSEYARLITNSVTGLNWALASHILFRVGGIFDQFNQW